MPQTPDYFRARAAECERLAAAAIGPETREVLTHLAHRWWALVALAEPQKTPPPNPERRPPPPSP